MLTGRAATLKIRGPTPWSASAPRPYFFKETTDVEAQTEQGARRPIADASASEAGASAVPEAEELMNVHLHEEPAELDAGLPASLCELTLDDGDDLDFGEPAPVFLRFDYRRLWRRDHR